MKVLRIVVTLYAIVAMAFAMLTFYWTRRSEAKEFTAEVISSSTLLNAELISTSEDFRLIYQGKDIPNVAVSNIRMTNSGRKEILTFDIEAPI